MFISQRTVFIILAILSVMLLSGCVRPDNVDITIPPTQTPPENNIEKNLTEYDLDSMVMVVHLPAGYEYIGSVNISDYNGLSSNIIKAKEGLYRDRDNIDVFLDIVELKSSTDATDLVTKYKATFEPKVNIPENNPFSDEFFNGHSATRIRTIRNQKPKYQIVWNTDRLVFIVRSNSEQEYSAQEIAKATGL